MRFIEQPGLRGMQKCGENNCLVATDFCRELELAWRRPKALFAFARRLSTSLDSDALLATVLPRYVKGTTTLRGVHSRQRRTGYFGFRANVWWTETQ